LDDENSFLSPEYPHENVSHAAGIGTSIKIWQRPWLEKVAGNGDSFIVEIICFEDEGVTIHLIEDKSIILPNGIGTENTFKNIAIN
jgi:hypothetical protein